MRNYRVLFFGIALTVCSCEARAESCDISKFKDYMSYTQDIMTNLSYINQVSSKEDRSKSDKADISIADYGSFTYGQASSITSSLESILNIKWSQRDQEWLLVSNLSDSGLDAYTKCLQSNDENFVATLSNSASGSDEFNVEYRWRPNYKAPDPARFNIVFSFGTSSDVPRKIPSPSAGAFHVKRTNMYKPFDMSIHVDDQPYETVSLPAFPAKTLQKQIRKNIESHEVYGGGNDTIKNVCITLDNTEQDEVIVPDSLSVKLDSTIAERASLTEIGSRTYNSRESCATIRWGLSANDGHVKGTATISALVLKAMPVANVAEVEVIGQTLMFKGQ
ncbi:hypothetical protein [Rhizobium miluonense]|uniref:Uncharacterized protein n=1 Tax=Rhizobium miluonense TaxID=411945 RepID=A0ABU1SML1_9HYPH|nr:hypothetical protein [Rhizobium miluonense]MDR6900212.1 hypothetical protein [Rhizobium miluonense]